MYLRPHTLLDACEALAAAPAVVLAGGTDFYPALGDRPPPARIVDISRVAGLSGIDRRADHVRIGAGTAWSRIVSADLPPCLEALRAAAREVGSVQIQNAGTIGGNLCNASPAADGVPPLLSLDASVELATRAGTRIVPLAEFLLGNRRTVRGADELLTAILVPMDLAEARSAFVKLGARRYLVISIVMVAALVLVEDGRVREARVAVGSCSAVARRLPALEAALRGHPVGPDGLSFQVRPEHLAPLTPIDDVRATAAYRDEAALALVGRALDLCLEPAR